MEIAKQMFAEYKAAVGRIKECKADFRDEMIVHLWEKVSATIAARKGLATDLNASQKQCAVYYRENDTLETRLAAISRRGTHVPVVEVIEE